MAFRANPLGVIKQQQGGLVGMEGREGLGAGPRILSDWGSHQGAGSQGPAWSDLYAKRLSRSQVIWN